MDIGDSINGFISQFGVGNAWCLVLGFFGFVGIALLVAAPKKQVQENPDEKLGRAVRSVWKQLQPPKDK